MPDSTKRLGRRAFLRTAGRAALSAAGLSAAAALARPAAAAPADRADAPRRPNLIIFFTDDQGYNDVGCFGSPDIATPNFDRMARQGTRLTDFYAMPVCGPSRAALMTGCYPIRVAEPGNTKGQHTILHPREVTIAEVLKAAGYATGIIGKWHLAGGRQAAYPPELMPLGQGFDSFFGTPLHNGFTRTVEEKSFRTQLMRDNEVLDDFLDQDEMNTLTRRYTEEAVRFIRDHAAGPFFLYLAHNMPHVPLGASEAFRGQSKRGLYGDVIQELDWSLAQVLQTLEETGLDRDTLVLFTSDNGPWIEKQIGDYAGCADPLRGSKMMTWDGGPRVPSIVRWPGHVPAGRTSGELVSTLDVLPTFARLAGTRPPADRTLDGLDVSDFLLGKTGKSPRTRYYFYCYTHLQAVREGRWKLVLPRPAHPKWCGWSARMVDAVGEAALYDLAEDIGETRSVAADHPDVVEHLMDVVEEARRDLGDYDRIGRGARFFDPGPRRPDVTRRADAPRRASKG
ncbi:MAG: sulfatase [Planctomycetes bacterium]|nr:sulfatase [Planctomycetota bacterium]